VPYQERQTFDEESDGAEDPTPQSGETTSRRSSLRLVLIVIAIAVMAAGIATVFAMMQSR
jgi:flagellar basal body-associated protein FliL